MARSTNAAAPTATRTLVRRPAVRWRYCRSAPISVPSTKAVNKLSSVSAKSAIWNVVRNRMDVSCRRVGKAKRAHGFRQYKTIVGTAQERLCPPYGLNDDELKL